MGRIGVFTAHGEAKPAQSTTLRFLNGESIGFGEAKGLQRLMNNRLRHP
jgi:hypothetical protein